MMNIKIVPISFEHSDLIVYWKNLPHVKSQVFDQTYMTIQKHEQWLKNYINEKKAFQFIIYLDEKKPVGSIFLKNIDLSNRKAELGIFIGEKDYLGKGIGKSAINLLLAFAFNEIKLKKIYLYVFSNNEIAINSYLKSGFKLDCILREDYFNIKYYDVSLMSILQSDWRKIV